MTVLAPEKTRTPARNLPPDPDSKHKYRFRSKFLLAGAIFAALNMCLTFFTPFPFDPYKFDYKGWAWWTFNELRHTSKVHNIALLGSSTMVSALAGCDANYLKSNLDLTNHHSSVYFQDSLKQAFKGDFESFSLAAPGQMPSDAYITLEGMVASSSRPDVVFYGVAPRDFIDSTLTAPGDTDAFRYITRLVNIDDIAQRVFRSPWAKLDWLFQRNLYLYCYGLDLRLQYNEIANSFLNWVLPRPNIKTLFTWWDRKLLLPGYLPAEIHPEAVMAGPIDRQTAETKYTDNTLEYMRRYGHPDIHTYRTQMYFLNKISEFCRKERIELVIVNMPVTLDNLHLLKPGGYLGYLQGLREFGLFNKVTVFDLNDFNKYSKKDFHDSVHLNAFGGLKFFDDLTAAVKTDVRLKEVLAMSGEHQAKHKEIASHISVPTF